jgi:hypothetical protein
MIKRYSKTELPLPCRFLWQFGWVIFLGWTKDIPRIYGVEVQAWDDWALDFGRLTLGCYRFNGTSIDELLAAAEAVEQRADETTAKD